ncbi:MAG: T9SS type A sorting domain-containing protein [Elusimicrobia bacterium]|nr:T9SS type A sorting domain-containing protein [Elusimicrobiota bacterium]
MDHTIKYISMMMLTGFLMLTGFPVSGGMIIDHAAVDLYDHIPQEYMDKVKTMWVNIPGESHSLGFRKGISLLAAQDPRFSAVITESGPPEPYREDALRISRIYRSQYGWATGTGENTWYTDANRRTILKDHVDYCNTNNLEITAIGFGWCWDMTWHNGPGGGIDPVYQVRWAGSSVGGPEGDLRWGLNAEDFSLTDNSICMNTYLAATQEYIDYCAHQNHTTKFIFTTGPVDGYTGESGYQKHLKNEYIRNYVNQDPSRILFDYADILCHNNDGEEYRINWTRGSEFGTYAGTMENYPNIHPDNMKDLNGLYEEDGDHIGEVGALRLGKAVWVMMARIAGWDGTPGGNEFTIERYGITWTFDKPYQVGQFVNGDWWIVPDTPGGTVTVISVDPPPTLTSEGKLIHGSMINPMPGRKECQSFDERIGYWTPDLVVEYPLTVSANQSLVSARCYEDGEQRPSYLWIKYVAVLTCLAEPAASTDFRPPYVGQEKPLYSSTKLRRDLLPDLEPVDKTPNITDLAEARFSRPWIEFGIGWSANAMRSAYESNYGREKAVDVGGGALLLCLDENQVGNKQPLLTGMVQVGIDLYHTLLNGGVWNAMGGHSMGRKFPILFAGLMLNHEGMLSIGKDYLPSTKTFQEDLMAFVVTQQDIDRRLNCEITNTAVAATNTTISVVGGCNITNPKPGELTGNTRLKGNYIAIIDGPGAGQKRYITADDAGWGNPAPPVVVCTVEPAWESMPVAGESVYQVLGYEEHHIGKAEWGGDHISNPERDNPSYYQPYRSLNLYSWPGEVLASYILNLKEAWNHDPTFQVIDEWMNETAPGGPYYGEFIRAWGASGISGDFIQNMWDTYRGNLPDPPDPDPDPQDPQDPHEPKEPSEEELKEPREQSIPKTTDLSLFNNLIKPVSDSPVIIQCELSEPSQLNVTVFSADGKEVAVLINEHRSAGVHRTTWTGKNTQGMAVGSGIYFVKMKAGSFTETKKIVFIK